MIILASFIIINLILILTIKKYYPECALLLSLAGGIIILSFLINNFLPIILNINKILNSGGLPSECYRILFKCLGICLLCQFCSDSCKDAKENALASKIEIAGKIMIISQSMPLFEKILEVTSKNLFSKSF